MVNFCELCGGEAYLHCAADSAFLCISCDGKFHASNFLFSRHLRRIICPDCKSLTGDFVSGPLPPWPPTTTTCCSRSSSSSSSSASSCCSSLDRVSSSDLRKEKKTTRPVVNRERVRERRVKAAVADGIFVNWCDDLGLNGDLRNGVVSLASLALAVELKPRETTKKVILAAAFWFGVRRSWRKKTMMTFPSLKKVEDVTGVASGLIRAVESKLGREMTMHLRRWRVDLEEGWAENDNV